LRIDRIATVAWLLWLIVVAACEGRAGAGWRPKRGLAGTVSDRGAVPGGTITIAITEATVGRDLGETTASRDGAFVVDVPPGDYALAITTQDGFAFVEHVRAPDLALRVELDRRCTRIHGRITGDVAVPAAANLSRYSRMTGDSFVVPLATSGAFEACLPPARYAAWVSGATVTQGSAIEVSDGGAVAMALDGWPRAVIETPAPAPVAAIPADLDSLVQALARGPRVVGMGEANHGTGDFYTRRGELALALARAGDLRYVLIEADAVAMLAIDDYAQGAAVELAPAITKIGFWVTDIEEMLAFVTGVRDYNAAQPAERRVHVLGIDAQFANLPAEWLVAHRAELALGDDEVAVLARVVADRKALDALGAADFAVLDAMLARIDATRPPADLAAVSARAVIAARALRHDRGYVGQAAYGVLRDAAMADLTALTIELGGPGQAAVWGHNAHVAGEPSGATESLGQHLRRRFPDYFPIAFLSYEGSARAWDEAGEIGVIPRDFGPAPPYTVEAALLRAAAGSPDVAWISYDRLSAELQRWLGTPRYVREFGSVFRPRPLTLRDIPTAFSAIVVLRHSSASTPTATGVRKATP
jgi:erythromycin esterase